MKSHALIGYNILKGKPSLALAAKIARGHHERWDGSGSLSHLKETEIPSPVRIAAVAEAFFQVQEGVPEIFRNHAS